MAPVTAAVMAGVKNGKYKDKRAKLKAAQQYAKRNEQLYRSSSSRIPTHAVSNRPDQEVEISSNARLGLFKKHDTNGSGKLDMNALFELLKEYESEKSDPQVLPSQAEASWIVEAASKSHQNFIAVTDLDLALLLWDSYVKNRSEIERLANRQAITNGQSFSFDQLKLYLSNLKVRPPKVTFQNNIFLISKHMRLMS